MKNMRIGLIKETKNPVDNRVALSPKQVAFLNAKYPQHEIIVQESDIRAFSDEEYRQLGVKVVADVGDCDVLFGIKEAKPETLIPNKRYVFFGHIAKMQEYNKPLLQNMMEKDITFSDYEYLVDAEGKRVCAFGWWAGVVGVYYTLRGYGLRTDSYTLPKPDLSFTLKNLIQNLKSVSLPAIKLLVTGDGRVSHGVQYVLEEIGALRMDESDFLSIPEVKDLSFCVAKANQLVRHKHLDEFSSEEFRQHPNEYVSDFKKWSAATDVLVCAHFWDSEAPVYLDTEDLKTTRIRMIGDITCDICGSIKSTLRSSTHDKPYYDYNPVTEKEETAFSSMDNITVMAVDTCPNALARDTSEFFGKMLIEHVFTPLLEGRRSDVIERSTIIKEGKLTERFAYLKDFAEGR